MTPAEIKLLARLVRRYVAEEVTEAAEKLHDELSESFADKQDLAFLRDSMLLWPTLEDLDRALLAARSWYRGVWRAGPLLKGGRYDKGDFVTHAGALWACNERNWNVQPGTPAGAAYWSLAVKRGKGNG